MIKHIKKAIENSLAFQVIDSFTEADEKLAQKLFTEKVNNGAKYVNMLIKLDALKIAHTSTKAFMEEVVWVLRNYKQIGNIAIVAHSNVLKALVPIDTFFFERLRKGFEERYSDISQLDEAFAFITKK